MSKFYITTPIYYVNSQPHIGHVYTTIVADIIARYHRMLGEQVFFLTGTDEHGAKIEKMANKEGKLPKEFVNEISAKFQFIWDELDISNNRFIRTTEEGHIKVVQNCLQYLYDKGDIYLSQYKGLYCRECEQFKSEKDLVDGKCPEHNIKPEKVEEECYMFKMSAYQDKLLKLIKSDKLKIRPKKYKNEVLSFYKNGLKDVAFSRKNVKWGISLPWDKSQTAYVWADAFLNYLTGLGWDGNIKKMPEMWPADIHLIGKDILRVHASIWPAMLLALNLPLPRQIFVHGFFLINGKKMSKSIGNVINPEDLISTYGTDVTKYLLISSTHFGDDSDVSLKKFNEKYNADLANGLGNLVSRIITMASKVQSGELGEQFKNTKTLNNIVELDKILQDYKKRFQTLEIDIAVDLIQKIIKKCDNYISKIKLWELASKDNKKFCKILYSLLEILYIIGWMCLPFMPETTEKIWKQLGIDLNNELKKSFNDIKVNNLKLNFKVKKGEILFPRIK